MKRKKNIVVILCIFFIALWSIARAIQTSARHSIVYSNVTNLAVFIEGYREDQGKYPISLNELSLGINSEYKAQLKRILNDQWQDCYKYKLGTNTFEIIVDMPSSCFFKTRQFEKKFKLGEALKAFDSKEPLSTH